MQICTPKSTHDITHTNMKTHTHTRTNTHMHTHHESAKNNAGTSASRSALACCISEPTKCTSMFLLRACCANPAQAHMRPKAHATEARAELAAKRA